LIWIFIAVRVHHLYCEDNERLALNPVVLFKLLSIGHLFVIAATGN
jgi:hypothetical protein